MLNQLLLAGLFFQGKPEVTGDVNSGLFYLIAAYAVVWLFIFGYLYSLNRRQSSLRRDIERLKQEEAEREQIRQPEAGSNSQPRPR